VLSGSQWSRNVGVQKTLRFYWRKNRKKNDLKASSPLNQINNQDDDRNDKQEMDQATANVAEESKKPEHN
jgi:hypothetical protein